MKHISILVPSGAILGSLEGSRQLLSQVNTILAQQGHDPVFEIELVGLKYETEISGGLYKINSQIIRDVLHTDLIIIPALDGDINESLENNKDFISWIKRRQSEGAEVASLCLGAFLLARTGLIDGKQCATHWVAAPLFRSMYPQVNLVTDKIITDENGIYSSGGAFSYQNLILYLIEKYVNREMAVMIAKIFAIEIDRMNQSAFIIFQGQKDHSDKSVLDAQTFIESNYAERLNVDAITQKVAVARRNFERRFKKATSNTIIEYIQRVRIEAAKKSIEEGQKNISEVMYQVGYTDNKTFRNIFKKITGLSPKEYKKKFNKTVDVSISETEEENFLL